MKTSKISRCSRRVSLKIVYSIWNNIIYLMRVDKRFIFVNGNNTVVAVRTKLKRDREQWQRLPNAASPQETVCVVPVRRVSAFGRRLFAVVDRRSECAGEWEARCLEHVRVRRYFICGLGIKVRGHRGCGCDPWKTERGRERIINICLCLYGNNQRRIRRVEGYVFTRGCHSRAMTPVSLYPVDADLCIDDDCEYRIIINYSPWRNLILLLFLYNLCRHLTDNVIFSFSVHFHSKLIEHYIL